MRKPVAVTPAPVQAAVSAKPVEAPEVKQPEDAPATRIEASDFAAGRIGTTVVADGRTCDEDIVHHDRRRRYGVRLRLERRDAESFLEIDSAFLTEPRAR
jgi:hypothetical protein